MSLVRRYVPAAVIATVLWALWPSGLPEGFEERASLAGVSSDIIGAYRAATPSTMLPIPLVWWLTTLLLFDYLTGRFKDWVKYRKYRESILGFGVLWAILGIFQWLFGAPFLTFDSGVYLRAALDPSSQFGAHHPSGTSWLLWVGRQLGLPVSATLAGVGALELTLLRQLCASVFGPLVSWMITALFLLYPDFLFIRLSLWSEPGMLLLIAASIVVLHAKNIGNLTRCVSLCGLFLAMSEIRHAAIFLLPGLAIAAGLATDYWRRGSSRMLVISAIVGFFIVSWMVLNFARTGNPRAPTTGSFECVHFIAAYHQVPFCSINPAIPLCEMDTGGSWLQQGEGKNPNFITLDRFIFRPESPLNKLSLSAEESCVLWGMIRRELVNNYKFECARLLVSRILGQFGSWEMSERGVSMFPEGVLGAIPLLDRVVSLSGRYVWPLWMVWVCALYVGGRGRRLCLPVVVFCLLGGIGHAAGIALNNPFLGLRYLAVSKYLVSFAAVILLSKERRPSER